MYLFPLAINFYFFISLLAKYKVKIFSKIGISHFIYSQKLKREGKKLFLSLRFFINILFVRIIEYHVCENKPNLHLD